MSFAIGIPTINRFDLLKPALMMYLVDFPNTHIYIVDNGNQNIDIKHERLIVYKMDFNVGVGASWNILCSKIFEKHDHALILNDDIYLGKRSDEINDFISKSGNQQRLFRSTADWCAFIMPKNIWETVGSFDECFFPAYYEDRSYEYRMKLRHIAPSKTPFLNPALYRASKTLEKMPEVLEASKKNRKLYIEMWGGEPEEETFTKRFNGEKDVCGFCYKVSPLFYVIDTWVIIGNRSKCLTCQGKFNKK